MTPRVHALADLRRPRPPQLFEGAKHGDGMAVSFFVTAHPPGEGPDLHFHPYAEAFLVQEGEATFTAGDEQVEAPAGQFVVVPPETPHGFENVGPGRSDRELPPEPRGHPDLALAQVRVADAAHAHPLRVVADPDARDLALRPYEMTDTRSSPETDMKQ